VAGNGSTFIVQNGGSATLIAGQNILFYPGTYVAHGGYMHGYIAPGGPWCATQFLPTVPSGSKMGFNPDDLNLFIFPNPTTSSFTLSFTREPAGERIDVKIFNMMGELIIQREIREGTNHEFSLELQSPGIYLVKVDRMGVSETRKIIKQ
jgi:hypothetical protein